MSTNWELKLTCSKNDCTLLVAPSSRNVLSERNLIKNSGVEHWLSFNSLFVNITNTEAMLFGTASRLSAVNSFFYITLNNNVIKWVFHFTYLGIVFDDRL